MGVHACCFPSHRKHTCVSGAVDDGADPGTVGHVARLGGMMACEGVTGHAWYGLQRAVMDHL